MGKRKKQREIKVFFFFSTNTMGSSMVDVKPSG